MVQWEPDTRAPQHVSLWTARASAAAHSSLSQDAEAILAAREDTNLLYVAITRAKQALIVSGVESSRVDESWYSRIAPRRRACKAMKLRTMRSSWATISLRSRLPSG
jgi:ATP-dependent helicase/nuclease subunit A